MIEAFLNYLTFEKRFSNKSVESYKIDLLQFFYFIKNDFETEDLLQIKHQHVRAFVVQLVSANNKPSSIKRKISAIKSFYKYCQKTGKIENNPADKINTPKSPERLPKFIEQQKINHLLEKPDLFFSKE
ncbi:MAG TPA: site-specific integrase, partial [Chitinophagales bacterium]|nr:site-specific integrase [Chitinophagales bacterium]